MVRTRGSKQHVPYSDRDAMIIVTLAGGDTAYVTVPVTTIKAGHEALARAIAERQERGDIPTGKIVDMKPVR